MPQRKLFPGFVTNEIKLRLPEPTVHAVDEKRGGLERSRFVATVLEDFFERSKSVAEKTLERMEERAALAMNTEERNDAWDLIARLQAENRAERKKTADLHRHLANALRTLPKKDMHRVSSLMRRVVHTLNALDQEGADLAERLERIQNYQAEVRR